uniref:Uncharacterized protein n=1 Tax=Arundo donax TaxID=35708 RepID=A0A0A8ZA23_ARUDO
MRQLSVLSQYSKAADLPSCQVVQKYWHWQVRFRGVETSNLDFGVYILQTEKNQG